MKTVTVALGDGLADVWRLLERAQPGGKVVLTRHGQPKAVLTAYPRRGRPWRAARPDDPARYGDLQAPVMEDWP